MRARRRVRFSSCSKDFLRIEISTELVLNGEVSGKRLVSESLCLPAVFLRSVCFMAVALLAFTKTKIKTIKQCFVSYLQVDIVSKFSK